MTVVLGALRQHKYEFIDVYKDEASTALKAVIKQVCLFNHLTPTVAVWVQL